MAGSNDKVRPPATFANDSRRPRSRVASLGLAVLAALWLLPSGLALAATITVTTVADENGSGPNCSLREAIASANGDADVGGCVGIGAYGADTIVFASTLSLPATITLTDPAGALTVSSDVTIIGPGATQLAIDGNHTARVFSISTGQVMMSDLTIQHGNSDHGGGISNGGTLTLTNCTLSGNSAFGHPPVPNVPGGGGGLGGGIANDGTLTLNNCTLSDNSATDGWPGYGGGIYNEHMTTLTNSTLSGNSAGDGGGIFNAVDADALTLTNCTLSGNSASGGPGYGGGIAAYGSATLRNTIVANSLSGGDCGIPAEINDDGHNLIEDAANSCGLTNGVNGNIVGVDPLVGPLANNGGPTQTIALLPDSPAINAGDSDVCANPPVNGLDQRGYARPGTGHTQCSIGAYEADAVSPEPCTGDCDGTGSVTVDELIAMVNVALGTISVVECGSGDANHDSQVTIDEILTAVDTALKGCSLPPMPPPRFLTEDAALYDYWPCFSPDGSSLVFSRTMDGVHWELRLVPVAGGSSVPFASAVLPVSATRANWSPNGDRIAFTGVSAVGANTLWLISAGGTDAHQVTMSGLSRSVLYPSFYPDGNRLAIVDFAGLAGLLSGGVLRMVDLEQETVTPLTERAEILAGLPAVSPDGERIAFAGQRNLGQVYDETQNAIFILEADGAVMQPDPGLGRTPAWSPDGEWIAFESARAISDARYAAFVMRPDGSGLRQLTEVWLDANHPVFSPDGKLLAFSASKPGWPATARGIAVIDLPDL